MPKLFDIPLCRLTKADFDRPSRSTTSEELVAMRMSHVVKKPVAVGSRREFPPRVQGHPAKGIFREIPAWRERA
jgi:hypothetical protein